MAIEKMKAQAAREIAAAFGRWTSIDWAFIRGMEGGQRLDAYVLKRKDGSVIGKSGVAVATGFDIGQHSEADFDKLEIWPPSTKDELREVLRPFFGAKGEDAKEALDRASREGRAPGLSPEQAEALDVAVLSCRSVG